MYTYTYKQTCIGIYHNTWLTLTHIKGFSLDVANSNTQKKKKKVGEKKNKSEKRENCLP